MALRRPIDTLHRRHKEETLKQRKAQQFGRKLQWQHNRYRYHDRWSVPPLLDNQTAPKNRAAIRRDTECKVGLGNADFVDAALRNYLENPFYKLPDSVIFEIMGLLDIVSLECLRRAGRLFLQLFERCDSVPTENKLMEYPWARSEVHLTQGQQRSFAALLAKDLYCTYCHAARLDTHWKQRVHNLTQVYLHCSGCKLDHPVCLFLPSERSKDRESRLCVGHTGFVRLCSHTSFRWSDVQRVASTPSTKKEGGISETIVKCQHGDHTQPCQQRPRGRLFPCLSSRKGWQEDEFPLYPRVFVRKNQGWLPVGSNVPHKSFAVFISWMAHINLSPGDQKLTPELLSKSLADLREKQGGFICPETEPGRIIEKMLFDPNRCNCLRYERLQPLGGTWHRSMRAPCTYRLVKGCLFGRQCERLGLLEKAQAHEQQIDQRPRKMTKEEKRALDREYMNQAHAVTLPAFQTLDSYVGIPQAGDCVIAAPW
ncbi:hypothetical protein QBC40DRAFT_231819 [Triangularia verruculosa]|uniref:F-box domain-containing protein n=1 Tax=Triangularia verruculosa TaxID=2587418 RepID=A0AAN6XCH7_9PEZI|nr:hypothetical protein QBC40DRAFT_231819 [Triangularia verruculosa]